MTQREELTAESLREWAELLGPVLTKHQEVMIFNGDVVLVTYPDPATVDPAVPYSEFGSMKTLGGRAADDGDVASLLWDTARFYRSELAQAWAEAERWRERAALLQHDNDGHAEFLSELHLMLKALLPEHPTTALLGRLLTAWRVEPGEKVYALRVDLEAAQAESFRLLRAASQQQYEVSNTLALALGYPRGPHPLICPLCEGECVQVEVCREQAEWGDHVAESLAAEAAGRLEQQAAELAQARAEVEGLRGALEAAAPMLKVGIKAHALPGSLDRSTHELAAGMALYELRSDAAQTGAQQALAALAQAPAQGAQEGE